MVVFADTFAAHVAERRLLHAWRNATANHKRRGPAWYPTMRAILERAADESGYTLEQAVAVLAITSPGAQVATNVAWTERALRSHGSEPVGRFPIVMGRKVRAVLECPERAAEIVSGPKVAAFYDAILGNDDALVIDRWAALAAGFDNRGKRKDGNEPTPRERRIIERAYRAAAAKVGQSVRDFQATVWIHARETTPHKRFGKPIRLADITA